MADNTESIGGVSISITGDASQLTTSLSAAGASAEMAGAQIAQSFNLDLKYIDQATGATVKFGQTVSQAQAEAAKMAATQVRLAAATEAAAAAATHQVSEIQAVSGTIRTLDGNQGIRAAERFLTMIPGLGAALQVAFPVIGAIALFEIFGRLLGKSEELTTAEKDLQSQVEATNKAFTDEAEAIDRVNAKYLGQKFGAAAGAQGEVAAARAQLADLQKDVQKEKDQLGVLATQAQGEILKRPTGGSVIEENYAPKFAAQGEKIQQALAKVATAEKELQLKIFEAGQTGLSQAGQQSAAYVALQEERLKHTSDLNKAYAADDLQQSHAAVSEQIAVLHNRSLAAAETAEEELRVEQAKQKNLTAALAEEIPKRLALIRQAGTAESQGKPESDQSRIELQTQTKLESAQADADRQTNEQYLRVRAAQATAAATTATAIRDEAKAQKDFNLELEHEATLWKERTAKASEFQAKFNETLTGVHPDTQREKDKVEPVNQAALQRLQGGNAIQQQLALAIQLKQVGIDTGNELQSRLKTLQNELSAAQSLNVPIEQRLELEKQILAVQALQEGQLTLQQQTTAALVAAQSKMQSNNQQIGQQIGQAIGDLPKEIGDDIGGAIANALFERHPGESIGQAMAKALTDALKQTAASLLKSLISGGIQLGLGALGFADGTDSAPGGFSMVGEKGPEIMYVPRGAQVIPNHKIKGYADGTPGYTRSYGGASHSTSIGELHVHAHGVNDPGSFARQAVALIPHELKRQSSSFSPYSH